MNAQKIVSLLYQKGAVLSVDSGDLQICAEEDVLDDELLRQVKMHKEDIIILLNKLERSAVEVKPQKKTYPSTYVCSASLAQQRILFMEELAGDNSYYNIPVIYRINGAVNRLALTFSLSRLVALHDILRSFYVLENNTYLQCVSEPAELQVNEFSLIDSIDKDQVLNEFLEKETHYHFNLKCEWPIRVSLIEYDVNEFILMINIHHIAADGWSGRSIVGEISVGYELYNRGAKNLVTIDYHERDYQYADYVEWQNTRQKSLRYQESKDYWSRMLKGVPELHSLPTDFTRPAIQSVAGDTYTQIIPINLLEKINFYASARKTTPFVIFQAVFSIFLARYSDQSDIVFGTASANRYPLEFINTVGLFVNTLVLRYAVPDNISFDELIDQAIAVSAQAYRYQELPFDVVVDEIRPTRSLGYNPLVQLMLVMQDGAESDFKLEGTKVTQILQKQKVSKFDLALHVYTGKEEVRIDWEYSTSLFKPNTIEVMSKHFSHLLDVCLSQPSINVNCIPLGLDKVEVRNVSPQQFPNPSCVHRLFEYQVKLAPNSIAIRDDGHILTYQELNDQANLVASHICSGTNEEGIRRIGLCMEKSIEWLVGVLAIFKVGATYVPLDPYYPKERLAWMLQDSSIDILLASSDTELPDGLEAIAQVFQVQTLLKTEAPTSYTSCANLDDPAYIIYTSGSTGKPKGVLVTHRSLFYSLHSNQSLMAIDKHDSMPTIGSQAFGVSLLEIFLPLISGGEVHPLKKAYITDIEQLIQRTNNVTVLHAVPSLMRQWLEAILLSHNHTCYPKLRLLLVGGESVPFDLLEKIKLWRPEIRLLELYGMTESAVVCASYAANDSSHRHYCIGKPHANTIFYVLNSFGQLQPTGVPGELHIGGLSLASQYINQPEITREKFIENPYAPGERLYKTGDRVRLLDDGNYEFLGRVDHQVSLRGIRIELGEIETLATELDDVLQAVACVVEIGADEKTLVLYYTSHTGSSGYVALSERIRAHFALYLPDYMRPSIIQYLDSFPLNPNGKVDRKNIPLPSLAPVIVEAETNTEHQLAEMWKLVLQSPAVGVTTNFFEIGGHSLMATKLATQIRAAFSIDLPLTALFEYPTIRSCAKYVDLILQEKYAQKLILKDELLESEDDDELII